MCIHERVNTYALVNAPCIHRVTFKKVEVPIVEGNQMIRSCGAEISPYKSDANGR